MTAEPVAADDLGEDPEGLILSFLGLNEPGIEPAAEQERRRVIEELINLEALTDSFLADVVDSRRVANE